MRRIDRRAFSQNSSTLRTKTILANLHGTHELPQDATVPFKINDITWNNTPIIQVDTSLYHTNAVIFNSYFENVVIESDNRAGTLILENTITYIPEGYAKYEVVYIRRQPYIIIKANIDGLLYVEWFRFGDCKQSPQYTTLKYTTRGINLGIKTVARSVGFVGKHAVRGASTGTDHTLRGVGTGVRSTTSIGRYIYNEPKMFYQPSRKFEDMSELAFIEKPIQVEGYHNP